MRILHVANFSENKYGKTFYATDRKISQGLIRNNHFVYDFSYRDVGRQESLFHSTKLSQAAVNRKLLETVDNILPDLLLLGHCELIHAATLATVRQKYPAMKIAMWYVDALFHRDKTRHLFQKTPYLDVIFTTTGGPLLHELAAGRTTGAYIPNMVDRSIECYTSFENSGWDQDFVFCGRDAGDPERRQFMENLNQALATDMRVSFHGCLGNAPLAGAAFLHILGRSKMGLNISRKNDVELYSSDRLAQLTGCGVLTFSPRVPGLEQLYREDELVFFDNLTDLIPKIRYYAKNDHEARQLAGKGWRKAHTSFSCERVTKFMIELLFATSFSERYEWEKEIFRPRARQVD